MKEPPTPYAMINGDLLPREQAGFPLHHQSLVDSFGIYETIKLEQGRFFHLAWHLRRLGESARILELALPASPEEIGRWSQQLAATVKGGRGLLRIVVYGSDGILPACCGLYFKPPKAWPSQAYEQGVWVVTSEGERTWPLAKSTNCLAQALARFHASRQGAYEGLLVDRHGHVTEGSTCNVMVVQSGELLRPLAGTALEGVTENIVAELATTLGIPMRRTALPLAGIDAWDEAFITSTTRNVMPLRQVNQVILPQSPGPVTCRLMTAYQAYEAEKGWTSARAVP